jgi:hypothetical protein
VSHHSATGGAGKPSVAGQNVVSQNADHEGEPLSQQEIEAIRQRLESLGYL